MYGTGCNIPEECTGMKGNTKVTYRSGCKVPGECRRMPRECNGVGAKSQGNAMGT